MKALANEFEKFFRPDKETNIYYLGIARTRKGYEEDLFAIMKHVPHKEIIGITLSKELDKRDDMRVLVADVYDLEGDGILFMPRPMQWARGHDRLSVLKTFSKRWPSICAYDLSADISNEEDRYHLTKRLMGETDARVKRLNFKGKDHIFLSDGN
ncbi:hypothetical protein GOV11_01495 [Candidatus Woesearchaeota archaeon]|nr:hypothetical protein [Candidatus Woesearchaeota archaeon]